MSIVNSSSPSYFAQMFQVLGGSYSTVTDLAKLRG